MKLQLKTFLADRFSEVGDFFTRLWWHFRSPEIANLERDDTFRKVMLVFREYLLDLDADIEGCGGDELAEIDQHFAAANELRRRVVAHVVEGADARGQYDSLPPAP